MKYSKKKFCGFILISFVLTCFIGYPPANGWEKPSSDYIERMAKGEKPGYLPPSIEEVTQGKVKTGDLITKDNVDLVKAYLAPSIYECVKRGMVLKMAKNLSPEEIAPRYFWEATVKNKGKAVIDQNGTVRLADGSNWPGGLPFPDPKMPLEAMANVKFGHIYDDYAFGPSVTPGTHCTDRLVSKEGKIEKENELEFWQVHTFGRLKTPPLGTVPGHEGYQWRTLVVFTRPRELKGLGQLTIRHYDEYKDPDEGFAYIPSVRRAIRISATTYQDNVGGGDYTQGDPQGIREPYAYWDFKSMQKKLMLLCVPYDGCLSVAEEGKTTPKFDHGHSFIRLNWTLAPTIVIEAVPKIKHIYGKKILYMPEPPYWYSTPVMGLGDFYDRKGEMWKSYFEFYHLPTKDGFPYGGQANGLSFFDLQTGHCTMDGPYYSAPNTGTPLGSLELTKLIQMGR